jgi:hypothetical protein
VLGIGDGHHDVRVLGHDSDRGSLRPGWSSRHRAKDSTASKSATTFNVIVDVAGGDLLRRREQFSGNPIPGTARRSGPRLARSSSPATFTLNEKNGEREVEEVQGQYVGAGGATHMEPHPTGGAPRAAVGLAEVLADLELATGLD